MKSKLKLLSVSITFIIGYVTILMLTDHNAVEVQSSVTCEQLVSTNRGLDYMQTYTLNSVTPINLSNREYEIEILSVNKDVETEENVDEEKEVEINYYWTTDRVNFRKEPSTKSEIIKTLDNRTKVGVISTSDGWSKVMYDNKEGYIKEEYLTNVELFTSDKNRWGIELSKSEIDLLAKILWLEARGESELGKIAVVEVVFNRMLSSNFPNTLKEVLSQKYQFTSWKNVDSASPIESEYECINKVLNKETNVLGFKYVYFSTSPRNNNGTVKIGNHYFCQE